MDIEIINGTNVILENSPKLQEFFKDSLDFSRNFKDHRNGLMSGGYEDANLSSHFGFCDSNKIEIALSPDMGIVFIYYLE